MKNSSQLRAAARQSLSGQWGGAVVMCLVYIILSSAVSAVPRVGSLLSLLLLPVGWSYAVAFLRNVRTKSPFAVGDLFAGFSDYTRLFSTLLLQGVYTLLWMLLLIVPGIIKSYSYAMTSFILKDEPALKNNAAIEKSMAMMEGHKWELFCLHLSFIGWVLLTILTLGIGYLWLGPYMTSATAHFYEDVKLDYERRKASGWC